MGLYRTLEQIKVILTFLVIKPQGSDQWHSYILERLTSTLILGTVNTRRAGTNSKILKTFFFFSILWRLMLCFYGSLRVSLTLLRN